MTSAIKDYISQCETCWAYETNQQKEKLCPHEIPERAWFKVAVDLFEHDDRQYLVTVDYFSNFWEVDRMENSTKSRAVIQKLKQHWLRATVNIRSYKVLTEDGAILRRNRRHLRAIQEVPTQPDPLNLSELNPDTQQ